MKFLHIFVLLLVTLVAYVSGQGCPAPGTPGGPICRGDRNVGRGGRGCTAVTRWYYDARSRQCREMRYLGCGGNRNRWCTRTACERRCRNRSG